MKVFLAIGNAMIEEKIESIEGLEVVDKEVNLMTLADLIDYVDTDYLIINRLLDNTVGGEVILDIARKAQKRNTRMILLTDDLSSSEAKKTISALVAEDVNAFISISNFDINNIVSYIEEYPSEFNFNQLATPEVKIIKEKEIIKEEVIKSELIKQEVIVCYSADSGIESAEVTRDLANALSLESDLKVLVIDLNTVTPSLDLLMGIDKDLKVNSKYDNEKQTSLEAIITAIDRGVLDYDIFRALVIRDKKYKFDIIPGMFDLIKEDKTSVEHYSKIIEMAKELYDSIIITVNPYIKNAATYISLVKSTKIIGLTNANYASIRNLKFTFSELDNTVDREKIYILINNICTHSLDKYVIQEALGKYKVIGFLPGDDKKELAINKQKDYLRDADKNIKDNISSVLRSIGYKLNKQKRKFGLIRR